MKQKLIKQWKAKLRGREKTTTTTKKKKKKQREKLLTKPENKSPTNTN